MKNLKAINEERWRALTGQPSNNGQSKAEEEAFPTHSVQPTQNLFADLARQFGAPMYVTEKGKPSKMNERFWAEYLIGERILIYERDEGRFYVYSPQSGCYQSVTRAALKAHLSDLWTEANNWAGCNGIKTLDSERARSSIIELASGAAEKRDFFVDRPPAIHCQNVMLQLDNGKVRVTPFGPEFRSRNQLSVAYEPGADCQRFCSELLGPAVSLEDIALAQKMAGLMVLGINRPQRIFMLDGDSGTGKTTLGRLMAGLIGHWNFSELRPEHLVGRFEMSRAFGKTLLFGPDVDADFMQSVGVYRLKSLVGGDPMDAERKNSNDHFPFFGTLNVLITSNCRLLIRLRGDLGAWLRRLIIIHFSGPGPAKRIDNFHEVLLKQEGSGILNWALAGLLAYEKDHCQRGDIILSAEQQARVTGLLTESDGLRRFLGTELVVSAGANVSTDEIALAYASYAKAKQWRSPRLRLLQEQVADLMLEIYGIPQSHNLLRPKLDDDGRPVTDKDGNVKTISVRGYRGVRLREEDEDDP